MLHQILAKIYLIVLISSRKGHMPVGTILWRTEIGVFNNIRSYPNTAKKSLPELLFLTTNEIKLFFRNLLLYLNLFILYILPLLLTFFLHILTIFCVIRCLSVIYDKDNLLKCSNTLHTQLHNKLLLYDISY